MLNFFNNKLLFMAGMFVGLSIMLCLCVLNKNNQIWQVDLSRVIASYSKQAARTGGSNDKIVKDFKNQLNAVIDVLPKSVILIGKENLLSGQTVIDRTEWFLVQMRLNNAKQNQESNTN